jgi:hypothetical protein
MSYIIRDGRRIEVETLNAGVTISNTRRLDHKAFAMVPLEWGAKAAKATNTTKAMVWIMLLHASWEANNVSFSFSNSRLKRAGVTRYTKYRALKELQAGGLITVEPNRGKAPTVTILKSVAVAHRYMCRSAQVA